MPLLIGSLLLATACERGISDSKTPRQVTTTVALSQATASVDDGATLQLSATALDQDGKPMQTQPAMAWASSDTAVARVDGTGLVTSNRPGEVQITATAADKSAAARVTVRPVVADVQPAGGDFQKGEPGAVLAEEVALRVVDRRGAGMAGVQVLMAVASGGGSVSPAQVATDAQGYARARWTLGSTSEVNTLTATPAGQTARRATFSASVVVRQPVSAAGGTVQSSGGEVNLQFPANAVGEAVSISVAPVAATAPTLPKETASSRLVPGAIYEFGPSGTQFAEPVRLAISYDPARLPSGVVEGTLRLFRAYPDGWRMISGSTVSVADRKVAASITGFSTYAVMALQAPPPNTTTAAITVQANTAGIAPSRVAVEVTGAGIATPLRAELSVAGTLASATLEVPAGAGRTFTVRAFDAHGIESHGGTVSVDVAAGQNTTVSAILRRRTEAVTAQASVAGTSATRLTGEVTGPGITTPIRADFTVSGGMASSTVQIPTGKGRVMAVRGFNAQGMETHRGSATTDVLPGQNLSLALTLQSLDGSLPITARVGTYTLSISPASATLRVGETLALSASGLDATGQLLSGFTWGSSNPAVASVDATGRVTAKYPGVTRIVANHQGFAVAASVTVTP